jgi:hypothetical protein
LTAVFDSNAARLDGVHTLGVDETAFLAATPTAGTTFATGIVALGGRPRLLDVVEGRSGTALHDWVSARDQAWRDRISVAALDPFRGYATACGPACRRPPECLMRSTSSDLVWTRSTRSAAGCSKRPSATAGTPATRCSGSVDCSAAATSTTANGPGPGC